MNTRICPECGAAFTPQSKTQVCCSKECQQKRCRRHDNESRRRAKHRKSVQLKRNLGGFGAALKATAPVTQEVLMCARQKPANCSDVRWRIELRRRANAEYFRVCGDSLPR